MSFFRQLFDRRARDAKRAETKGDLRRAAELWAEMGDRTVASGLFVRAAERQSGQERVHTLLDALHWTPEEAVEERARIEGLVGEAMLDDARAAGTQGADARRRLEEAAGRLERGARWVLAADCWELLGRTDELARCLEEAGEVERLEKVLDASNRVEERANRLRRLLSEHDASKAVGARRAARRALREAAALAPEDSSIPVMQRRLEEKWPKRDRLVLRVGERQHTLVARVPVTLGRSDADLVFRGASVSRRHAQIDVADAGLVVRDLGSRNGTLVSGVALGGELRASGPTEIGLGDDVTLRLVPRGKSLEIEVTRGLDRGHRALVGPGPLRIEGLAAQLHFDDEGPLLRVEPGGSATLGVQPIAREVELLVGDLLRIDGVEVEVVE